MWAVFIEDFSGLRNGSRLLDMGPVGAVRIAIHFLLLSRGSQAAPGRSRGCGGFGCWQVPVPGGTTQKACLPVSNLPVSLNQALTLSALRLLSVTMRGHLDLSCRHVMRTPCLCCCCMWLSPQGAVKGDNATLISLRSSVIFRDLNSGKTRSLASLQKRIQYHQS